MRSSRSRARISILAVLVACLGAACSSRAPASLPTGSLAIGSGSSQVNVRVEIADTDASRRTGLMNRTGLAPDSGMVFLFDGPTDSSFWMKDTLIPLSIAFWDADGRIVAILDMQPCRADPCPQYSPGMSYVGALEVNLGFFDAHGVEVGEHVELDR
jgi:uncharacterized membrane protein (UPF0127 family)